MNTAKPNMSSGTPAHMADHRKRIALFGSTGSIGTQALEVIEANPDKFRVTILTAHSTGT